MSFAGKTIVHYTSHGTQGMAAAAAADEILSAGFVNASAVVRYLEGQGAKPVSLVCLGNYGGAEAEEDDALASYIVERLAGSPILRRCGSGCKAAPMGLSF